MRGYPGSVIGKGKVDGSIPFGGTIFLLKYPDVAEARSERTRAFPFPGKRWGSARENPSNDGALAVRAEAMGFATPCPWSLERRAESPGGRFVRAMSPVRSWLATLYSIIFHESAIAARDPL